MDETKLDLEEILKEFSDSPPPPEADPTADTIRLDQIQKAVKESQAGSDTAVFSPVGTPEKLPPKPKKTPPEAKDWEAEYEPAEDYTPPIEFRPKGRQRQLRSKLAGGPEKRYYELMDLGFGKLQVGILLNILIFTVAAGSTVLFAMGMVSPERLRLVVFIQLLSMLLASLVGCNRLLEGAADVVLRRRFTLRSLLCVTFCVCCIDAVMCLADQRISCSAIYCMQMLMAQIAAYDRRCTELGQMDTLRKATDLHAVVACPDYDAGKPGYVTRPGEPEAFMDNYRQPSGPEKLLNLYGLAALGASLLLGILGWILGSFADGLQITAGALLLSMPATAFISMITPAAILEKRLHKLGVVLCGWQGIRAVPKKIIYPLTHEDLLPTGSVKLNGTKFLGNLPPERVIACAASLADTDGGTLAEILEQQLLARNGRLRTVEDFHSYDGGVTGVVDGLPASMGTLEFMQRMGITPPKGTVIPQAVYIAIDGELAGVFALAYNRSKSTSLGLRTLCGYRDLEPVLVSGDFLLTEEFLQEKFGSCTSRIRLSDRKSRQILASTEPEPADPVVALSTREGLAPKAYAVTGARMLNLSLQTGLWIHLLGGAIGLLAAAILTLVGGVDTLNPANLLIYSLIWMVPGWLSTQWTRFL